MNDDDVCVHLTGVGPTACRAGVDYDSVKAGTRRPEWPCTSPAVPCASRLLPAAQLAANQKWFDELAEQGVRIVHPDDGWVDREANTIRLVSPTMQHALPAPGVLVALGTREKWRKVMLTREVLQPVGMSSVWAFVEERPAVGDGPKAAEPDVDDEARALGERWIKAGGGWRPRMAALLADWPTPVTVTDEGDWSDGRRAEDVTITASPTYPDPTGWIRALREPAPSTAPTDRRLQVLARLIDVAGAAVGLEDFVASTRAEYPDVFADLDEHLALVRAGIAAVEAGPAEDGWPVQHTELCRSRGALTIAESWWCRCSGELAEYHSPGGRVDVPNGQGVGLDEPLDPSLWSQVLDRAQVAALAGERPSLAVQTEPREAGWLHRTVESVAPKPEPIGPFHALQAVYEDGGKCWLRVTTTAGTTIFRSTDEGATWTIDRPRPTGELPKRAALPTASRSPSPSAPRVRGCSGWRCCHLCDLVKDSAPAVDLVAFDAPHTLAELRRRLDALPIRALLIIPASLDHSVIDAHPTIRFDRLDPDAAVYTLIHADGATEEIRQPYTRAAPHYRNGEPVWQWDGNAEAPTLTPSFHHRSRGVVVHLFLTRGAIRLCADSDAKVAS